MNANARAIEKKLEERIDRSAWNKAINTYALELLEDITDDEEVHPMMNQNSGNVFLTNSEYQVAMMNGDKLESFYWLSYHGNEGFLDELLIDYENGNIQEEDWEQLADICEANGEEEKAEEIRNRLNEE